MTKRQYMRGIRKHLRHFYAMAKSSAFMREGGLLSSYYYFWSYIEQYARRRQKKDIKDVD